MPFRLMAACVFTIWLTAACGPLAASPTPTTTPTPSSTPTASATPTITPTPRPRSAVLSELWHEVEARPRAAADWAAASEGQTVAANGGVKTGAESRARVDISDGSVIRLAASTTFTLTELSPSPNDPVTRFLLDAGKVWLAVTQALGGGIFEIETPVGVATVRGSLMSVEYFAANGHMIVTCLEGACRLTARSGAFVDLEAGEQAEIAAFGQDPSTAQTIDAAQVSAWATEFPEAAAAVATTTPGAPPTSTPTPTVPPTPIAQPGQWSGQTERGWTISFTVTDDRQITLIALRFPRGALVYCQNPLAEISGWRTAEEAFFPIVNDQFAFEFPNGTNIEGQFSSVSEATGNFRYVFVSTNDTRCPGATLDVSGMWTASGP
ncbi:MAG: FecR family protein [Anaerolineales bacterium]